MQTSKKHSISISALILLSLFISSSVIVLTIPLQLQGALSQDCKISKNDDYGSTIECKTNDPNVTIDNSVVYGFISGIAGSTITATISCEKGFANHTKECGIGSVHRGIILSGSDNKTNGCITHWSCSAV